MKKTIYHEKLKNSTHRKKHFGVQKVGLSCVFHNVGLNPTRVGLF